MSKKGAERDGWVLEKLVESEGLEEWQWLFKIIMAASNKSFVCK